MLRKTLFFAVLLPSFALASEVDNSEAVKIFKQNKEELSILGKMAERCSALIDDGDFDAAERRCLPFAKSFSDFYVNIKPAVDYSTYDYNGGLQEFCSQDKSLIPICMDVASILTGYRKTKKAIEMGAIQ